jgi:hypothetical protein
MPRVRSQVILKILSAAAAALLIGVSAAMLFEREDSRSFRGCVFVEFISSGKRYLKLNENMKRK